MLNNDLIDRIIMNEGGLIDHKDDRGGRTNYGITQPSWEDYCSRVGAGLSTVDQITVDQAREFYRERLYRAKINLLPVRFWYPVADWQVNSGTHAIKHFQRTLNTLGATLLEDGYLGNVTASVAQKHNSKETVDRYIAERVKFYARLVRDDPTQLTFLVGWINRTFKCSSWYST